MEFKNNYKIIYEARERVSEEKPGPIYASKTIPSIADAMLISYNKVSGEYVDLKSFKLIYSYEKKMYGCVSGIADRNVDIELIIKNANGEEVFGE